jgi:hypothetical protein
MDGIYHNQNNIDNLLTYLYDIRTFSSERLREEYEKVQRQYSANSNYYNAIRLSLVLILPNSDFHDTVRAINTLEKVSQEQQENNESIVKLAFLLKYFINENRNSELLYEITNKQLDRVIEENRKQEMLYKKISSNLNKIKKEKKQQNALYKKLYKQLNEKEQTVEKLQKTIEDLKAIERSINKRKNVKAPST